MGSRKLASGRRRGSRGEWNVFFTIGRWAAGAGAVQKNAVLDKVQFEQISGSEIGLSREKSS